MCILARVSRNGMKKKIPREQYNNIKILKLLLCTAIEV